MTKMATNGNVLTINAADPDDGAAAVAAMGSESIELNMVGRLTLSRWGGRGDWIRTSDLHTPSVMRYQAALRPDRAGARGTREAGDLGRSRAYGKHAH